ncbi:MAG: tryptophanase [Candidatus Electryoneaceae bacterium]|nr:tryptophanase [Candidatus Electryoneaceae bacterium]
MLSPNQVCYEPYKIKTVEPIEATDPLTKESVVFREQVLQQAHYNLFFIPAREIVIDLLTDSGTGAMSQAQWSAMMLGDESYAQATSFFRFEKAVRDVTSPDFHIIPTHQGRVAENILFYTLFKLASEATSPKQPPRHRILINSYFDTTAANVSLHGGHDDLASNELVVDQNYPDQFEHGIFGGNINLDRLEEILQNESTRREVLMVMITTTNNTGGGLPVSLANIKAVRQMIDRYAADDPVLADGMPPLMFFLDACRFAENAYFIQQYEPGYKDMSVVDIGREMFRLVDGCTMSAKKDGMVNIGGFLTCRSEELKERFWEFMVEVEGFFTYGGLSGRDMEAVAVGVREGVDDARVAHRVLQVQRLWQSLKDEGIPVKEPCGGHGVFVHGRKFWEKDGQPLIAPKDLPGHTLANELYRRYGIRSCEIGTIMFGGYDSATNKPAKPTTGDYVRLAVPRRVYTDKHLEYVAASLVELYAQREQSPWRGMQFTFRPTALPHFLSRFEPICV